MTRKEMATAYHNAITEWERTGSADAADALAEIENDLCGYLDIPLDWTEQGLNIKAENVLRTFLRDNGFDAPPTWSEQWSVDPA